MHDHESLFKHFSTVVALLFHSNLFCCFLRCTPFSRLLRFGILHLKTLIMLRLTILLLVIMLLGTSLALSSATKTKRATLFEQITRPESSKSSLAAAPSGESMCICASGCYGAQSSDFSVDDTFYVHCRATGDGEPCSQDLDCKTACMNCCDAYGYTDLKGEASCAENIGKCFIGIPPKCAAM